MGILNTMMMETLLSLKRLYMILRDYAKPLISMYIDDLHPEETKGGISFGHFDAFAGVSLDDGTSWRTTNLSRFFGFILIYVIGRVQRWI